MAVTVNKPVQIDDRSWSLTWSSTLSDPTYYIYVDGELIDTTTAESKIFSVENGASLVVDILDVATGTPGTAFPGRFTIGWNAVSGADVYLIDEYVASVWTNRAEIKETGRGYYLWRSRFLEDVTTHQFRVRAKGNNQNIGTALSLTRLMVRHPDPPDQNFSYSNSTKKVTVSA